METNFISGMKSASQISKTTQATTVKTAPASLAKKDQVSLSAHAKEMMETKKFVAILQKMPDVRPHVLDKEYNTSPPVLKEVARKIALEGF